MTTEGIKRKLSAILSADVEGYSRLMSQDEVGTIRTLTAYRESMTTLIQQYKGRVVDAPGDNLLAEFSSVIDAVNCAVEIQRELAERNAELPSARIMAFRIGINLGDVVVEEGRLYGDGVNIAARIEGLAEGGGICISGTVYDQVKNKLGLEYEFLGEQTVKNIPEPVRVYRVLSFPGAAAHRVIKAKKAVGKTWRSMVLAAAVTLVAGVAAVTIWKFYIRPAPPSMEVASVDKMSFPIPDKPSIAVLPFDNISGGERHVVLVDGITEGIIAALARFNQLFVIARNSTFTYKGRPVKVQQVAEDLGVRYVLEGSVQISDNRIRVTAQLIDATRGMHVWVERFDRDLKDAFEVQDEVTRKIVGSMVGKLDRAATVMALLKHPDSLDAYGLLMRGLELWSHFKQDDNTKSRELLKKAVKLDPNYGSAYAVLAWTHLADWQWYGSPSPKESYGKALELAHKAVALDPRDAYARWALGYILLYGNKHDEAIAQFEEGLKANPNHADLLAGSVDPYVFNGQPEEAIKRVKEAMRLNPYYPNWYTFQLGIAQYVARKYEGAIATLRKMSPLGVPRRIVAACLAYLGRKDEARAEAEKFLKDNPSFSTHHWGNTQPFRYDKDRQHAVQGYIMAGLPEHPPLPLPDKPSIAVLPFVNMSGDPEQEYFSDGLTEEIINALSKISRLFVIARHSSFTYKGKPISIPTVGRELGVQYVLEGSVRRMGDKVRITAQLIDAKTNHHLWAERYDRELKDIFAIQDEITMKIITELAVKLTAGEQARAFAKGTDNLQAYLKTLQAGEYILRFNKEDTIRARQLAEQAIKLDPGYALAHAWLGFIYNMDVWYSSKSVKESLARAFELSQKALDMDESLSFPHVTLGSIYLLQRQHDKAIAEYEQALALEPNSASNIAFLGRVLYYSGRPEEAIVMFKKALRLNPFPESWYLYSLGNAYSLMGQYEEAIAACKKAIRVEPKNLWPHMILAQAYSSLGRNEEARSEAAEVLRIQPNFSVEYIGKTLPFKNPADRDRFVEALRKAGLK